MDKDIIFVTYNSTPCTLMSLKIHPGLGKKNKRVDVLKFIFYITLSVLYVMTMGPEGNGCKPVDESALECKDISEGA